MRNTRSIVLRVEKKFMLAGIIKTAGKINIGIDLNLKCGLLRILVLVCRLFNSHSPIKSNNFYAESYLPSFASKFNAYLTRRRREAFQETGTDRFRVKLSRN